MLKNHWGLFALSIMGISTSTLFAGAPPLSSNDLSTWVYSNYAQPFLLGPIYPGDTAAVGSMSPDDDMDGSVVDLDLVVGSADSSLQESLQTWRSPIGAISFVNGVTYRVRFSIRELIPAPGGHLVEGRVRWGHGSYSRMGGGSNRLRPQVNAPAADNTVYSLVFDALDVVTASNPAEADPSVQENDITLFFEAIDLFTNGQGGIELENMTVEIVNQATVLANQTLIHEVTDFTTETGINIVDYSLATNSVSRSASAAVISTGVGGDSDRRFQVYGGPFLNLQNLEVGTFPMPVPATSGLIYRSEFDVEMTNSMETPQCNMVMRIRTTEEGVPRDTSSTYLTSLRENNELNPAFTDGGTYSAYHHFPDDYIADGISGSDFAYGDGIATSIALQDESATQGGTITLTGMRIYTVPESIFE